MQRSRRRTGRHFGSPRFMVSLLETLIIGKHLGRATGPEGNRQRARGMGTPHRTGRRA